MRFEQLPEGAQKVLEGWVTKVDIQSIVQPDPTLYCVIESHGRKGFEHSRNYSLITAFQLGVGGDWVVSADVQMGSAEEVLMYLGRRSE